MWELLTSVLTQGVLSYEGNYLSILKRQAQSVQNVYRKTPHRFFQQLKVIDLSLLDKDLEEKTFPVKPNYLAKPNTHS